MSVNIIGPPGSGKTTLSKKLSKELQTEIINLDELFEKLNDKSKVLTHLEKCILSKQKIIIDGTYCSILSNTRLGKTDVFILLEKNPFICTTRIIKRNIFKKELFNNEKLSLKILKVIFVFNRLYRKILLSKIPSQKIFILK